MSASVTHQKLETFLDLHPTPCEWGDNVFEPIGAAPALWRALFHCGSYECPHCNSLGVQSGRINLDALQACLQDGLGTEVVSMRINREIGCAELALTSVLAELLRYPSIPLAIVEPSQHMILVKEVAELSFEHAVPTFWHEDGRICLETYEESGDTMICSHDSTGYLAMRNSLHLAIFAEVWHAQGLDTSFLYDQYDSWYGKYCGYMLDVFCLDTSTEMDFALKFHCLHAPCITISDSQVPSHLHPSRRNLITKWNNMVMFYRMAPVLLSSFPPPARTLIHAFLVDPSVKARHRRLDQRMDIVSPHEMARGARATPIETQSSSLPCGINDEPLADLQQSDMSDGEKQDAYKQTVEQVLGESVQTALQEEQAFLADAVMRSKADAPLNSDGVVIMRLKRIGNLHDVVAALLDSTHLLGPISRVIDAGCEVNPKWTPAILLVPLTKEQVEELGMELSVHHIIGRQSDKELIIAALKEMPSKKRPSVVAPPNLATTPLSGEGVRGCMADTVTVDVEHTFLHFRCPKDVSELSTCVQSAPGGDADSCQPVNPRRWRKQA